MDRPLPQSLDAERGLLGILMEQNDTLFEVSHLIRGSDFIEPWHGELFTLIRDMVETDREAKPLTLLHDVSLDADIGGITASEYLARLLADAPSPTMARTFARTIRDLSMRRRLISVASQHLDEAYSAPATITAQEIETRYHAASSSLFATIEEAGMQSLGDVGKAVLKDTQKALQGDRRMGRSSGLKALDDLWGTLLPGRLYGIAGASGSGKTGLAWQIARKIEEDERAFHPEAPARTLFESLEMSAEELATRDLTYLTGIASEKIERADLNEEEFRQLVEAQKYQKTTTLVIDDLKGQTVGAIRGRALRLKRMHGLTGLLIDHWRYIKATAKGGKSGGDGFLMDAMNDDLRALNALADDLEVPVILLAQLKANYGQEMTQIKAGQAPKIREPNVGDIFNGAVLEQECDALILVHREEYMLARMRPPDSADAAARADWGTMMGKVKNRATLILNKRRGGAGYGRRTIGFDGPTTRFSDEIPKIDFMEPLLA